MTSTTTIASKNNEIHDALSRVRAASQRPPVNPNFELKPLREYTFYQHTPIHLTPSGELPENIPPPRLIYTPDPILAATIAPPASANTNTSTNSAEINTNTPPSDDNAREHPQQDNTFNAQPAMQPSTSNANHIPIRPLGPQTQIPNFTGLAVIEGQIRRVSYDDNYRGHWFVIFFYPMDFEGPEEIIAFNDRADEFFNIHGAELLACSCDSEHSHLIWSKIKRKRGGLSGLTIPLLSDFNKQIARSFGVLSEERGTPHRGLFIIDPSGQIRHVIVSSPFVSHNVDEVLRVISALKSGDRPTQGII